MGKAPIQKDFGAASYYPGSIEFESNRFVRRNRG
jgi:hypothetical protein